MAITNLQTLTKTEFDAALRALIERLEGNKTLPYYDTTGNPTIGIGFNIYDQAIRDNVFAEMRGMREAASMQTVANDADFVLVERRAA